MIRVYRLYHPKYSLEQAVSGKGAELHGGRWNSRGQAVIYTSESRSLAALELLVHLNRSQILQQYLIVKIQLSEENIFELPSKDLPSDWSKVSLDPITQSIGDFWINSSASVGLRVPSAVIHQEYNILLNPKHDNWPESVTIQAPTAFDFDHRLQK